MAFEPEDQGQEQSASESTQPQPEAGQTEVPLELLTQISSQIAGLTEQLSDMKGELSSLKNENSELRDQLSAVATPKDSSEEAATHDEGSWKSYEKDDFASDFDEALTHLKNADEQDQSQQDAAALSEASTIDRESPTENVQNEPEASEGEPADGGAEQDQAQQEEPIIAEVSQGEAEPDDDEIQQLLTAAEANTTEVVPDDEQSGTGPETSGKVDTSAVSDDEIQAMFAQASAGATEGPSEPDTSEEPELAVSDDEPTDIVEEQPVEEDAPHAEAEKPIEESREAMSEDEIASLIAAEAEKTASAIAKPEEMVDESEEETVEVGFTALQAGKEVDDEVSEEQSSSADEEEEEVEEPVERRELVTVSFEIDEEAVGKVPSHLAIAALAVPVSVSEAGLVCKVVTPIDRASIDLIEVAVAMQVVAEPAPMEEVLDALRSAYGSEFLRDEREAVMGVAPSRYKSNKRENGFLRRAA